MEDTINNSKQREEIFSLFIVNFNLRFSDIEKKLNIRSNHLDYHLKKMISEGILEKNGEQYCLTKNAQTIIPFYTQAKKGERGPLTIVVVAIKSKDKICLLKREKRPYQNYWGLIGGKVKNEESIEESAVREAEEETGLLCKFNKIKSVIHERVGEKGIVKHAFTIFFCEVNSQDNLIESTDEGVVQWFSLDNLPKDIIPSDKEMIEKHLKRKDFVFSEVTVEEDERGELKRFNMKDYN